MNTLIAGPCSLENYDISYSVLSGLIPCIKDRDFYFKASFDKANRSTTQGDRGPGLEKGIEIFKQLRKDFPEVKLLTDVHEISQVKKLVGIVDVIQIPAFLCRQSDLIIEASRYFNYINIKKGQWMNPTNIVGVVDKIKEINSNASAWLTERGTSFGYSQLIVDFSTVDYFKKYFDKVILDCTHSTQRVKQNGRTGGDYKLAIKYFKCADIFNYDGVFAETHPDPNTAISDQDSMIPLQTFKTLL